MSTFKYSLEICSHTNRGQTYSLSRSENIIGRGDVDISINDPTLSNSHCLIRNHGNHVTVTDLQSSNGTQLNNKKILHETRLSSGDVLTLGDVQLRVAAASERQKLSVAAVSKNTQGKRQTLVGKMSDTFRLGSRTKAPYEKLTTRFLTFLFLSAWIILLSPTIFLTADQLKKAGIERGCALVRALAASNIEAMRQENQLMVDTSIVNKERGVTMALILTNQGKVWAPEALLNKTASDEFGKKSLAAEQLIIQKRNDGALDISMPIKSYDYKTGESIKLGVARMYYDVDELLTGPNLFMILGFCSLVFFILSKYAAHRIISTVKEDLFAFQEDCEDVIKGNAQFLDEKYSPEFNELTVTFNRMLRKLSRPAGDDGFEEEYKLKELTGKLLQDVSQAAICINQANMIVAGNNQADKLFAPSGQSIVNRSILELQCRPAFFQEFIEFACEASLSRQRKEAVFARPEAGISRGVSIPLEKGLTVILLSLYESPRQRAEGSMPE